MYFRFDKCFKKATNAYQKAPKNVKSAINNLPLPFKSNLPELFWQKGVLKIFAKFTGKHLCQSLFLNKVAGFNFFLKRDPLVSVFLVYCIIDKSRHIALFAFNRSIKKLLSIDYVNIYLSSICFPNDFPRWKKLFSI